MSPRRSRAAGHRHLKSGVHELRLDCEVLELLRHDPELLAIADAVAATQLLDTDEGLAGTRRNTIRRSRGPSPDEGCPSLEGRGRRASERHVTWAGVRECELTPGALHEDFITHLYETGRVPGSSWHRAALCHACYRLRTVCGAAVLAKPSSVETSSPRRPSWRGPLLSMTWLPSRPNCRQSPDRPGRSGMVVSTDQVTPSPS